MPLTIVGYLEEKLGPEAVAHTFNLIYSRGRNGEDGGAKS
jgi:hypothetical protein